MLVNGQRKKKLSANSGEPFPTIAADSHQGHCFGKVKQEDNSVLFAKTDEVHSIAVRAVCCHHVIIFALIAHIFPAKCCDE